MRHLNKKLALSLGVALLITSPAVAAHGAARASKPKVWRIGLEGPLTGSQSDIGIGMLEGAQLAAKQINAAGGVLGRQVQIVPIDDAADPTVGVAAAKAAIQAGLDGIVGPYNSGVGLQTLPLYINDKLVPIRLTSSTSTEGYGVTLQPMNDQISPIAVQALTTWQKNTSVAVVYDNSTAYTQGADTSLVAGLQAAGVTVSANIPIIPSATNDPAVIQAAVTQALATHPTGVYADLYYPEGALVADQMLAEGTGTNCLADYASASVGYVTDAGIPAVQNCPVLGVPAPSDFAGSAPFLAAFEAEFHSAPGLWSPYTYDSVNLLVQSAIKAHTFQQIPLARVLYATKNFVGWTGSATILSPSGNRTPSTVTVDTSDASGTLHVDLDWATAVGYTP
ncbi:MAG TPA: branched-chain amino acid ABC transporter substrate-binding protein [Actinomycetota bacterium]|nr:branched-chain amino acid ABC transporter substrate-binding protein [Actinomycetota bacterium]